MGENIMLKIEKKQMSESYLLGALLAIVGGYLDAYTYISRGKVFANAQTGNIILGGLNLAERNWIKTLYYLIPILAFVLGVYMSDMIKSKYKQNTSFHWRQRVVLIEIAVLFFVAYIPMGKLDIIANTAVSFVCSLQYGSFRKFTTTMCTGNLRSATDLLFTYRNTKNLQAKKNSLQTYGIILFFVIGVVFGTLLTQSFMEKAVIFSCIILTVVFGIMFIKEDIEKTGAKE
jgi:uncharacterized membrane protein YoaK (UPF0700 family)